MKNNTPDYILLGVISAIIFCGLFPLASASSIGSETRFLNQIIFGLLPGIIIAFVLYKTPLHVIQKISPYLFFINIILLAIIILPFFPEIVQVTRGSGRWIMVGPFSFQPSEFLKLSFILYTASWLVSKTVKPQKDYKKSIKEVLLPFLVISGLIAVLLEQQPDLSTLIIVLGAGFIIYFIAKTPLWHTVVIAGTAIVPLFMFIITSPYRMERIKTIFDPTSDILGKGLHAWQMMIAVGSGGLFGKGIGMSMQKYGHVPLPASDSIFAIYAEEVGFIGSILLISLFLLFFWRGFLIAKNNKNDFARLICFGICSWIFLQMTVNVAAAIGGPVTGIPLPLISHGKSHLIAELAAIGLMLNASKYIKR